MSQEPRNTYYIVMPPTKAGEVSAMRPLSRLLQEEESATRARFENPTFQILKRFAKKGNAEGLANQLRALGINAFAVSDSLVAGHLFLWAESASQGAGGLAFRDYSHQPVYCPYEDILAVCAGPVFRTDGTETLLLDLHRASTPITPRIDASFFDFAAITGKQGSDVYSLIELIRSRNGTMDIDLAFNDVATHLEPALKRGLATLPGEFPPPKEKLRVPYDSKRLRLFGVYSFLTRERLAAAARAA